jgi:hypothetical protein
MATLYVVVPCIDWIDPQKKNGGGQDDRIVGYADWHTRV